MRLVLFISLASLFLYSCVEEDKSPKKTPTIYGTEFCDCVIKNDMDDTKCQHIIEENKEVFGAENKEAEAEFKSAAIQCITNKTRNKNKKE